MATARRRVPHQRLRCHSSRAPVRHHPHSRHRRHHRAPQRVPRPAAGPRHPLNRRRLHLSSRRRRHLEAPQLELEPRVLVGQAPLPELLGRRAGPQPPPGRGLPQLPQDHQVRFSLSGGDPVNTQWCPYSYAFGFQGSVLEGVGMPSSCSLDFMKT